MKLSLPEFGQSLPAHQQSDEVLSFLANRRSTTAIMMEGPGPDEETLDQILTLASRVPDHRKMVPFRFVVFEGEDRAAFSEVIVEAAKKRDDDVKDQPEELIRSLFLRGAMVIAVISKVDPTHRTPEWEQILTSGAVCQNLLIAASASGFAAQWLSDWMAYDENVLNALGLEQDERIAGYIYLGTAKEDPKERPRPDVPSLISRWTTTL